MSLFDVLGKGKEDLSHPRTAFLEILAQYVTIINSPKSSEVIGVLVSIMGQDFVDMLNEFYDNLYVDDKGYEHVEGGSRHGP